MVCCRKEGILRSKDEGAGINNNYWFEPLRTVRDLSNLKITSEINYVCLINLGPSIGLHMMARTHGSYSTFNSVSAHIKLVSRFIFQYIRQRHIQAYYVEQSAAVIRRLIVFSSFKAERG